MSDQNKSRKESIIDKSLGITSSSDDDFDLNSSDTSNDVSDEQKLREESVQKRRDIVLEQQNALSKYVAEEDVGYDQDETFARDILKDLAMSGVSLLKIQEEEMQLDPSARNAETAATLITATTNAVDKLQGIGLNNKKLAIEEKKVGVKEVQNGINAHVGAMLSCTFSELIGQLKNEKAEVGKVQGKEIKDAEAEVIEDEVEEDADEQHDE